MSTPLYLFFKKSLGAIAYPFSMWYWWNCHSLYTPTIGAGQSPLYLYHHPLPSQHTGSIKHHPLKSGISLKADTDMTGWYPFFYNLGVGVGSHKSQGVGLPGPSSFDLLDLAKPEAHQSLSFTSHVGQFPFPFSFGWIYIINIPQILAVSHYCIKIFNPDWVSTNSSLLAKSG